MLPQNRDAAHFAVARVFKECGKSRIGEALSSTARSGCATFSVACSDAGLFCANGRIRWPLMRRATTLRDRRKPQLHGGYEQSHRRLRTRGIRSGKPSEPLESDYNFIWCGGQVKFRAALLIEFQARGNVQLSQGDLPRPRTRGPVIRVGVKEIALDHILTHFFHVSITKYDYSGRQFWKRRGYRCRLSDSRMRIGCLAGSRLRRLVGGWQLAAGRNPHPLAVMILQKERFDRACRSRRRLSGLRDKHRGWRRLRLDVKFVVSVKVRIKIGREQKPRIIQKAPLRRPGDPDSSAKPG
jgi:hypothetical protein